VFALFGIVLFFVGAVLFVNGMALLGRGDSKGGAPLNLLVGLLTLFVNVYFVIERPFGDPDSYYFAATGMLFSFTYLWNAFNATFGLDGRAFGWFCLFVAITAIPVSYRSYYSDWRFAAFWASWGALWFLYFMILALKREDPKFLRFTGYATLAVAVLTCWVPGYAILIGRW
jgi:putative amide transporter protein